MNGFSGGPVDPVTLRLLDEQRSKMEAADISLSTSRAHLEAASAFLPVTESAAARKLGDLIEAVLFSRVVSVLENDPEAEAMMKILREFDAERDVARRAVKRLMNQHPDAPVRRTNAEER